MKNEAQSLQARLAVLPFPAAWLPVLANGFIAGQRWAARSSGILEDAGETAAAGLHETYLALSDLPSLQDAV